MKGRKVFNFTWFFVAVLLIFVVFSFSAFSQTGDFEFYKGKVITVIVPYSPGGGFDAYARAIAPYLEKYIPESTVIVKNIPGGGSLVGTNTLYRAEPDGLTIGILNGAGMALNQIIESEGVDFDLAKMSWLCRVVADPRVWVVGGVTPFNKLEDIKEADREIVFAITGVGSDDYFGSAISADALGIPIRAVTGFPGQAEVNLAVVRGEGIDATECELSQLLPFIYEGDMRAILSMTLERIKTMPDIPTALELVTDESKKTDLEVIINIFEANRVLAGPPDIPEDRLAALRHALGKSFEDPEFIEWAEKAERPLDFLDGNTMAALIQQALGNAEKIKPLLKSLQTKE